MTFGYVWDVMKRYIQMSTLPGTVSVIYSDLIPVTVSVSAEKLHHITSRATR
jgi:hypothetical protein